MRTRATTRGLELSELGLGASQLGNLARVTSDHDARETVDASWAGGVRYFDTAPHYGLGLAERRLGALLAEHPRGDYVLSTKVGRILEPSPETAGQRDDQGFDVPATFRRRIDFSRDGILRSVEASLDRLGLDRIDVLYLHDPDDPEHFAQAASAGIAALIELREQGVVRAVGAGMNFAEPLAELIRRADVDLVMCAGRFSLVDPTALQELLPLAQERGVGVVAAGVFNSGLLARDRPPADASFNYAPAPAELIARTTRIAEICEAHGVTLPEVAIGYVRRHPAVSSVVLGARGRAQAEQNLARFTAHIPDALWGELASAGLIQEYTP